MNECYNCGEPGHIAKNCSSKYYNGKESINGTFVTGRVFFRTSKKSISKNQCYKCNKIGHIARDCELQNVVCFNCAEEGHFVKDCLAQVRKVCYNCKSDDHLIKDCPMNDQKSPAKDPQSSHENLQSSNVITVSENDDQKSQIRSSTPVSNTAKNYQCYKCQEFGHIARYCPQSLTKELICYKCNTPGHLARDCQPDTCYRCNRTGHLARNCNFY